MKEPTGDTFQDEVRIMTLQYVMLNKKNGKWISNLKKRVLSQEDLLVFNIVGINEGTHFYLVDFSYLTYTNKPYHHHYCSELDQKI